METFDKTMGINRISIYVMHMTKPPYGSSYWPQKEEDWTISPQGHFGKFVIHSQVINFNEKNITLNLELQDLPSISSLERSEGVEPEDVLAKRKNDLQRLDGLCLLLSCSLMIPALDC
ncbi:uncharacterized protein ACIBXB_004234 isoform 1-T2 [Morphnus guianensis]